MEFLLDITVRLPAEMDDERRRDLIGAERVRGRELLESGAIAHIWRIPGALRNVSIWNARDPTELHELVTSLPSYPYAEIRVLPLASHPLQGGAADG
jgi:muconolactone D-isomerase